MIKHIKLLILLTAIILSLLVRELPYINVLFISKLWIFYILLFFFLYPPKRMGFIIFMIFLLLGIIVICSILDLGVFAEVIGSFVFVLLCIFFGLKLFYFLKED